MKGGVGGGGYSQIGIPLLESDDEDFFPGNWKRKCCTFSGFSNWIVDFCKKVKRVALRAWEMGHSDPRKIIFSIKMGLALIIMSLLIFLKQPFPDVGRYSVWAILTVVVVFEFSI
ncbi:aluminum-activated malate transporter 9-like protein, partial [Trifolium pratense]